MSIFAYEPVCYVETSFDFDEDVLKEYFREISENIYKVAPDFSTYFDTVEMIVATKNEFLELLVNPDPNFSITGTETFTTDKIENFIKNFGRYRKEVQKDLSELDKLTKIERKRKREIEFIRQQHVLISEKIEELETYEKKLDVEKYRLQSLINELKAEVHETKSFIHKLKEGIYTVFENVKEKIIEKFGYMFKVERGINLRKRTVKDIEKDEKEIIKKIETLQKEVNDLKAERERLEKRYKNDKKIIKELEKENETYFYNEDFDNEL